MLRQAVTGAHARACVLDVRGALSYQTFLTHTAVQRRAHHFSMAIGVCWIRQTPARNDLSGDVADGRTYAGANWEIRSMKQRDGKTVTPNNTFARRDFLQRSVGLLAAGSLLSHSAFASESNLTQETTMSTTQEW